MWKKKKSTIYNDTLLIFQDKKTKQIRAIIDSNVAGQEPDPVALQFMQDKTLEYYPVRYIH